LRGRAYLPSRDDDSACYNRMHNDNYRMRHNNRMYNYDDNCAAQQFRHYDDNCAAQQLYYNNDSNNYDDCCLPHNDNHSAAAFDHCLPHDEKAMANNSLTPDSHLPNVANQAHKANDNPLPHNNCNNGCNIGNDDYYSAAAVDHYYHLSDNKKNPPIHRIVNQALLVHADDRCLRAAHQHNAAQHNRFNAIRDERSLGRHRAAPENRHAARPVGVSRWRGDVVGLRRRLADEKKRLIGFDYIFRICGLQ